MIEHRTILDVLHAWFTCVTIVGFGFPLAIMFKASVERDKTIKELAKEIRAALEEIKEASDE